MVATCGSVYAHSLSSSKCTIAVSASLVGGTDGGQVEESSGGADNGVSELSTISGFALLMDHLASDDDPGFLFSEAQMTELARSHGAPPCEIYIGTEPF